MEEVDNLDFDFDNDLGGDFGDLSLEIDTPADDRSPATVATDKVLDTVVSKASDTDALLDGIKDALPKNYKTTVEFGEKNLRNLDRAKSALINPVRQEIPELKRNISRLSPMVERMLGESAGSRFKDFFKVEDSDGVGAEDETQLEIQGAVSNLMAGWNEKQDELRSTDMVQKLIDDQTEEGRFKVTFDVLASIDLSMRKLASFNETVNAESARQMLGLDIKKLHVLKQMLELQTESFGAQITELKAITKNTGLPEIIKQNNSELVTQMFQENWYGGVAEKVGDHARTYFDRWGSNLIEAAKNKGEEVADNLRSVSDMAGMMADVDEAQQEMGGPQQSNRDMAIEGGAGIATSLGIGKVTEAARKRFVEFMRANPKANELGERLALFNSDMVGNTQRGIEGYDGFGSNILQALYELAPTIGEDREKVTTSLEENLTAQAQWNMMSQETLVEIIPGWLSKIHLAIKELGGYEGEAETYDIYTRQFVTEREATERMLSKIATDSERETVAEVIREMFDALGIDPDSDLGREANNGLRNEILSQARNKTGLDFEEVLANNTLSPEMEELLQNAINSGSNQFQGAFSDKLTGESRDTRLKLQSQFKKLGREVDELQERFNVVDKSGNLDLLRRAGLLDDEGLKHDAFAEVLYRERSDEDKLAGTTDRDLNRYSSRELRGKVKEDTFKDTTGYTPEFNVDIDFDFAKDELRWAREWRDNYWESFEAYTSTLMDKVAEGSREILESLGILTENLKGNNQEVTAANSKAVESSNLLSSLLARQEANDEFRDTFWDKYQSYQGETAAADYTVITERQDVANDLLSQLVAGVAVIGGGESEGAASWFKESLSGVSKRAKGLFTGYYDTISGVFDRGRKTLFKGLDTIGQFGEGILDSFNGTGDVYINGETDPALTGKGIDKGIYFKWENGKPGTLIQTFEDIDGPVWDAEARRIVISQDDFDKGIYQRSRGGIRRLGGAIGDLAGKAVNFMATPWRTAFNIAGSVLSTANSAVDSARKYLADKLNRARDLFDADGELAVTAEEILSGKMFYMDGDKQVWITSLKDLLDARGDVFIMNGEFPEIKIPKEKMQRGLRDIQGKLVEFKSLVDGFIGKGMDVLGSVAKTGAKVFTAPLKLLRKLGDGVMDAVDKRMVKSMFVDLPDDIIFRTNTVYIYADNIGDFSGAGGGTDGSGPTDVTGAPLDPSGRTMADRFDEFMNRKEKEAEAGESKDKADPEVKLTEDREESVTESISDNLSSKMDERLQGVKDKLEGLKETGRKEREALFDKLKNGDKVKGDFDGDGDRDGGWRDRIKKMAEKRASQKDETSGAAPTGKEDKEMKGLSKLLQSLVGLVGAGFGFIKGGLGSVLSGAGTLLGGLKFALPESLAGSAAASAAGGVISTAAKTTAGALGAAGAWAGRKAASAGGAVVAAAAGAPLLAAAITIGASAWAVWEVGSSIYGYYDRRSELGHFEMGRFLQYGYYTGNDGSYLSNKVALRYFESEMLSKLQSIDGGGADILATPDSLWEEYASDLGGDETNVDERRRFTEWYNRRFKPVLFKWISVLANYKNSDAGWFEGDEITFSNVDDALPEKLWPKFIDEIFDFKPLSFDPLMVGAGASFSMPIQAYRKESRDFFDKYILKIEDVVMEKDSGKLAMAYAEVQQTKVEEAREQIRSGVTPKDVGDGVSALAKAGINPKLIKSYVEAPISVPEPLGEESAETPQDAPEGELGPNSVSMVVEPEPLPDIIDERIAKYDHYIAAASQKYGVDEKLIRTVIREESSGRPDAVSKVGATGLMQLMPVTAREVGTKNRFDPEQNIHGGTAYLRKKLDEFDGDSKLALAAYNAGATNVKRAILKAGTRNADDVLAALPQVTGKRSKETIDYVNDIAKRYPMDTPKPEVDIEPIATPAEINQELMARVNNVVNLPNEQQDDAIDDGYMRSIASAASENVMISRDILSVNGRQLAELKRLVELLEEGAVASPMPIPDLPKPEKDDSTLVVQAPRPNRDTEVVTSSIRAGVKRTV